jgi:hypothetical protein
MQGDAIINQFLEFKSIIISALIISGIVWYGIRKFGKDLCDKKSICGMFLIFIVFMSVGPHEFKSYGETDIWSVYTFKKLVVGSSFVWLTYSLFILGVIGVLKRLIQGCRKSTNR